MKKQVLALAILSLSTVAFSQKSEVKALEKAVKSEKFTETATLITAAEKLMGNADAKTKSKFYFLKTKSALNGDNYEAMAKALAEFDANDTSKYDVEIKQLRNTITQKLLNEVVSNQEAADSSDKLFAAYKLSGDQEYLYFAASGYIGKKDYNKALPLYLELKELNYTGVKTEYRAYSKETKKDELFPNKSMRSLSVKAGTHIKPTETKTPSLRGDIVKNIAYMYVDLGDTDNAIAAIKDARSTDPTDVSLLMTEANLYLKLDKKDKFEELMLVAIKQDPTNPTLFFNLGVISAQGGNTEKAKEYYTKSLALDDSDINSNLNIAALILDGEKELVEQMNSLGTSSADYKKYDALQLKRNDIYKEALPYLEKILSVDAKNKNAANTLKGIYSILGDRVKFKEMKALLETL